jgi:hypothetical protein
MTKSEFVLRFYETPIRKDGVRRGERPTIHLGYCRDEAISMPI